jgi:protein SCO1/2
MSLTAYRRRLLRLRQGGHVLLVLVLVVIAHAGAHAQLNPEAPKEVQGVSVEQKLDQQIPLDLTFTDDNGRPVQLSKYFQGERPVLLSLVYYKCPMLCSLVLNGMVQSLAEIDWVPGEQFEIVTVSIDPQDTPTGARLKKQTYLADYGRAGAENGWHFLTGDSANIERLAESVGFNYTYLEDTGEYAHGATLFVLTPAGRISRYLLGINHSPRTMRLSLVEASEGQIGSPMDKFLLTCFRYDETKGRYAPVARRMMRLGGGVTVLLLGSALLGYWRHEVKSKRVV